MCFHSNWIQLAACTTSTPGVYCIALVWGDSLFPPGLTRKMMKNQLTTERRRIFQLGQDVRRGGFPLDWWVVRQLVVDLASVKVGFSKTPSRHLLMGPMQFPCSSLFFVAPILPRCAAHVGKNPYWHAAHFFNHLQALGISELRWGLKVSSNCCYQMPPASRTAYRMMTRWKSDGAVVFFQAKEDFNL